jgi:hypothetical protein
MFKLQKIVGFLLPKLTFVSGGAGSSSTQAQLTPEQTEYLKLQTNALKDVFMPAYTSTIQGAGDVYKQQAGTQTALANQGAKQAAFSAQQGTEGGLGMIQQGAAGLQGLFDPQYEKNQVNAALQAGRESARESQAGQNAMYGGAGGLGSSRMALADTNLASLNAQRQATAAAGAQSQVQQNRMAAANSMMGAGQNAWTTGLAAGTQAANLAGSPMDLYNKYASVVYGVPQASTTPNFAGTQGSTSSGSGFNMGIGK